MITAAMCLAFLDQIDVNATVTGENGPALLQWLALIYPILGKEEMEGYKDIPIVASFLADPVQAGLEEILADLSEYYCLKVSPQHKIRPGIQIASLDNGMYYASIQVFPGGIGSRSIVSKATEGTALLAIQQAYNNWKVLSKQLEEEVAEARRKSAVAQAEAANVSQLTKEACS